MSLIISAIQKGSIIVDTNFLEEQEPAPHNNLFGFELCRKTLWGNDLISELGCELIYSLKNTNIFAFDEEIEKLESEFLILLDNLDTIELHTDYDKEFIEFRVRNALEMIKVVFKEKDKVGIAIW
ncbi:hypothetical protein BSK66_09905 [Paenibacillus odorifer]|uniref:Uncharacterized protein n=1 Tax=Paenibacillus odorifer TaxID=189426 RepID=A0A1R0XDM1_9BACL|nr:MULTISPECIES: hypothetical protein [Paenibacillus]ETT45464.1 hypothetical protein C171_32256 [Paenibacillus sp. FSL H8-237]OMD33175.1 hypothetical protein BJP51_12490 [Paenibacillus odorifer]OME59654.1 hypothetical protein BSK66_09905 [Paenibacillus odorifer]